MSTVDWKSLEGKFLKIDVGSTKQEALSSTDPSKLYITTDNNIVMNGEVVADVAPIATNLSNGLMSSSDKKKLETLSTNIRDLGNYDTEENALNALKDVSICGDKDVVHIHLTYGDQNSITMIQSIENDYCRQIIFNKSKIFHRSIYFTDSNRTQISYIKDWSFLFGDTLKWDNDSHKYLLSQFDNTFNKQYTDPIPMVSSTTDGLMSKDDKIKLEDLNSWNYIGILSSWNGIAKLTTGSTESEILTALAITPLRGNKTTTKSELFAILDQCAINKKFLKESSTNANVFVNHIDSCYVIYILGNKAAVLNGKLVGTLILRSITITANSNETLAVLKNPLEIKLEDINKKIVTIESRLDKLGDIVFPTATPLTPNTPAQSNILDWDETTSSETIAAYLTGDLSFDNIIRTIENGGSLCCQLLRGTGVIDTYPVSNLKTFKQGGVELQNNLYSFSFDFDDVNITITKRLSDNTYLCLKQRSIKKIQSDFEITSNCTTSNVSISYPNLINEYDEKTLKLQSATQSQAGVMSSDDKTKLDSIPTVAKVIYGFSNVDLTTVDEQYYPSTTSKYSFGESIQIYTTKGKDIPSNINKEKFGVWFGMYLDNNTYKRYATEDIVGMSSDKFYKQIPNNFANGKYLFVDNDKNYRSLFKGSMVIDAEKNGDYQVIISMKDIKKIFGK